MIASYRRLSALPCGKLCKFTILFLASYFVFSGVTAVAADPLKEDAGHPSCCQSSEPGKAVLPAQQFDGRVAESYAAAKKIPETCCKLFCYCGCDVLDQHTSLLDCFTSDHNATCTVCQNEVLEALRLKDESKSLAAIQQEIDEHFLPEYSFEQQPSQALLQYRAHRLYKVGSGSTAKKSN